MSLGGFGPSGGGTATQSVEVINIQRPGTTITGAGFRAVGSFTLTGGLLSTGNVLLVTAQIGRVSGTGNYNARISYGGSVVATQVSGIQQRLISWFYLYANGATNAQRGVTSQWGAGNTEGSGGVAVDSTVNQTVLIEMDLSTDGDQFVCRLLQSVLYRTP